jgi:hypothetical protein
MRGTQTVALVVILTTGLLSGCRVEHDSHADGDNVKVATPFGGMSVKTNETAVMDGLGLPVYPGAELLKKKDKDDGAADVNFSFGGFQLRVKAASYRTPDSPDKVQAFYMKALGRYGDVIQCENNKAVGAARTSEGLTCDNEKENHISVNDDMSGKMELKAGSKQHQHIAAIDPDGSGTKIGLVALDLPGHISIDDSNSNGRQTQ